MIQALSKQHYPGMKKAVATAYDMTEAAVDGLSFSALRFLYAAIGINDSTVIAAPDLMFAAEEAYNILLNYDSTSAFERDNARRGLAAALVKAGR